MSKYLDFDAFRSEQKQEFMEIKVYGEIEKLPASPPAEIILDVMAMASQSNDAQVAIDKIEKMTVGLFGRDRLDRWFAKGMTWSELEALMKMTMEMYHQPQEAVNEAKSKTPRKRK